VARRGARSVEDWFPPNPTSPEAGYEEGVVRLGSGWSVSRNRPASRPDFRFLDSGELRIVVTTLFCSP
jgi:hypothetical protein